MKCFIIDGLYENNIKNIEFMKLLKKELKQYARINTELNNNLDVEIINVINADDIINNYLEIDDCYVFANTVTIKKLLKMICKNYEYFYVYNVLDENYPKNEKVFKFEISLIKFYKDKIKKDWFK